MTTNENPAMKPTVYIDSAAGLSTVLGTSAAVSPRQNQTSLTVLLGLAVAAGGGIGFLAPRLTAEKPGVNDVRCAWGSDVTDQVRT
ncbi:MAG TPA: hypothetical protein VD793_02715 [Gemmatimonadales bacterium]|nr:hypothetical protein [Gemmatimonadales bacterium]